LTSTVEILLVIATGFAKRQQEDSYVVRHGCRNVVNMVPYILFVRHTWAESVWMVEACRPVTSRSRHMSVVFGFFRKLSFRSFLINNCISSKRWNLNWK